MAVNAAHRPTRPVADTQFARDVMAGLTARPKRLSPKYFYDAAGAQLFDEITTLPQYYPTRCELAILRENAAAIARLIPQDAALIEFGSGSSKKARILLAAAPQVAAYVPVDISIRYAHRPRRRASPRLPAAPGIAGRGRFHAAVPPAGGGRRHGTHRLLSGLDHRQFRAAPGLLVPAPCRPRSRHQRNPHHRCRSDQGCETSQCRL